ncbi:MAG TPA: DNA mismatch repair endonuclease MutL, partial [Candidatus Woesebacteria bacterium]|nr:DNA mismatch repair endonuclease MutL [Candidatus Woesebacteria bacterium]
MKKIHELPEHIRIKLAAGEIIERPAYIVKELIDNAIDAKATTIRIDLEQNGLGKIVVTDNGTGMSREDLEISFKLHTTSKIQTEEDFEKIITMGFRGEALASIAAVATVTIASREVDSEFGYEIKIVNGNLISLSPKGLPVGTQVKIEHIFSQLPVRK